MARELSSVQLTRASLERIQQVEPKLHALVTITDELALKQARKADELIAAGDASPLTGIPVRIPLVQMLSLISTGMPVRGLASPLTISLSAFSACFSASSLVVVTKARTFGSTSPMRSNTALVNSTEDNCLALSSRCAS